MSDALTLLSGDAQDFVEKVWASRIHLHRTDPKQENKLTIHVLFRPSHPSLLADAIWRERCSNVFVELRAYLMGAPSG